MAELKGSKKSRRVMEEFKLGTGRKPILSYRMLKVPRSELMKQLASKDKIIEETRRWAIYWSGKKLTVKALYELRSILDGVEIIG